MSSGFFSGPVPPWGYVVGFCVCLLFLCVGELDGWRRCAREAREELAWKREQAKARRTHPVYWRGHLEPLTLDQGPIPLEVAHEDRLAWEDQALTLANKQPGWIVGRMGLQQAPPEPVLDPTAVLSPEEMSWTGEIQRMTAAFQEDMARIMGGTDEQLKGITR